MKNPAFIRVRHKPTGKFLGTKQWGERLNVKGKFYNSIPLARAALKLSLAAGDRHGLRVKDFEVIEYELKVKAVHPATKPK